MVFSNTEVGWDGRDIKHVQETRHVLHAKFLAKISTLSDQVLVEHLDVEGRWLYIRVDDKGQSPFAV
jgi:hypothetical protein